eukprot:Amastigsp_a175099_193.p1 type:complete len:332 gc:universal Amastigsp_a175099_193:1016-21(-)
MSLTPLPSSDTSVTRESALSVSAPSSAPGGRTDAEAATGGGAPKAHEAVDLLRDRKVTLNDLMHWSVKYSDAEILHEMREREREQPNFEPIDPKWVEALFPLDSDKMREALRALEDAETSLADRETALDLLLFLVDAIDNAVDLPKLNGLEVLERVVRSSGVDSLRVGALWVLATSLQNNPETQAAFLARPSLLALVLETLGDPGASREVRLKAVGIVSALCTDAERVLALDKSVGLLGALVRATDPSEIEHPVQRRLAFLFTKLAGLSGGVASAVVAAGAIAPLMAVRAEAIARGAEELVEQLAAFFGQLSDAGLLNRETRRKLTQTMRA